MGTLTGAGESSQVVHWARHAFAALIEHVRVDHGRFHAGVAQQLLNGSDVVSVFKKVRGETVAKGVAARRLGDAGQAASDFDRALNYRIMGGPAMALAGLPIYKMAARRESHRP